MYPALPSAVKKVGTSQVPLNRLLEAVHELVAKFPFPNENQLNLTAKDEKSTDPYAGVGSFYDRQLDRLIDAERNYQKIHPLILETPLGALLQEMKNQTSFGMGRTRLMRLPPKRCYSFHFDGEPRLHFVIKTNPQCYMAFENSGQSTQSIYMNARPEVDVKYFHLPADAGFYFTDTTRYHTAFNGGDEDRLHIVMSLIPAEASTTP